MDWERLANQLSNDIDNILDGKLDRAHDECPTEYEKALEMAFILSETDFSTESNVQDRIYQQILIRSGKQKSYGDVVVRMKNFIKTNTPLHYLGTVAAIALVVFALASPGTVKAMASSATEKIVKILRLSEYVSVIQLNNTGPTTQPTGSNTPVSSSATVMKTGSGEVRVENDGTIPVEMNHYTTISDAQEAVCFEILVPEYLPDGYSFKEAQTYSGSDEYINLYFSGRGKDIILMERILNENTRFGLATDTSVDSVKINGVEGAWIEPHSLMWVDDDVSLNLCSQGFSKSEALKIANSIK